AENNRNDEAHKNEMEPCSLKIMGDGPGMFAQAADADEKSVEEQDRTATCAPAAKKFSEHDIPAADRLGEQREDGAIFAFGRNLARGGCDSDDERGNPNEQET